MEGHTAQRPPMDRHGVIGGHGEFTGGYTDVGAVEAPRERPSMRKILGGFAYNVYSRLARVGNPGMANLPEAPENKPSAEIGPHGVIGGVGAYHSGPEAAGADEEPLHEQPFGPDGVIK